QLTQRECMKTLYASRKAARAPAASRDGDEPPSELPATASNKKPVRHPSRRNLICRIKSPSVDRCGVIAVHFQIGLLTCAATVFIAGCSRCIRLTGAYNNGGTRDGKCRRRLFFCLIVLR